jgi:PAS domain S-box-containing protein
MDKRFKILAVDDDPVNISVMASALMDEYDVITALNGHDAISLVKEHIPDLILLDIMMPDLNGFEVCSIIKSYQEYADIPVIFLTALDTYDGELRGLELGAVDYLTKPMNFNLLKLRVRNHIALKERNEELREANQFSEQIINSELEGVIVYDLDLTTRIWNPFMEQITGISASEIVGRHPSEFFPFVQDAGFIERMEKVLAGEAPATIDFPYSVPKTGKSGWVSDLSTPLLNTKGEIVGIIALVRDITWRRRIIEELQQALEETKSANSTMSQLLRTVAHEFRTPLGLLTASTDILDRYWDRLTVEKRSEQNEHIRSAARQLSNLLNSVILFTQMGTDIPKKPPRMLDIESVCRSIAAEIVTFWGAGHAFKVTITADCGTALLNETLFRRILENLLTNSFRYTPSDGTVSLNVKRKKNLLCLTISDTGIGIPEEEHKLIFDAFYRSDNVEGQRGLGLGLSIVHEALSDMGGTITVKSRTGEGTTMMVEIPAICEQQ